MLSLAKVGRGRWEYYLATVAGGREEPRGLIEPDGAWLGASAAALGLDGRPVDATRLGALLDGVDPSTGERLDPAHHRVRVAGYDCTFAAPKSVSLLHALGAPDVVAEVRAAHEASVSAALGYLEHEAARVRHRTGGADRVVPTTGVAAASFVHRTSRAPDPHLHSHVLVANLGCDLSGRWSALDARPLFVHAGTAGALYRAQLRDELVRRLDVSWRWREDGFAELAGVRPEVLRAFSRRHEAIVEGLASSGRSGARAARIVAASSRPEKDLSTPYETLVDAWRERAHAAGVSAGRVAAMAARRGGVQVGSPSGSPLRRADPLDVTSRPFTRRDLVRARSQELHDGGRVADVVAAVDAEIAARLAAGELVADPQRSLSRATLQRRSGARIPSGIGDEVLVTRDYLELEDTLSRAVAAAPEPGTGRLDPGLYALGSKGGSFSVATRLSEVVAQAVGDGRRVVLSALGPRRGALLEAFTGIEVVTEARSTSRVAPHSTRDGPLLVVGDAEQWDLPRLAALVGSVEATSATLVLAPSCLGGGRRSLVAAFGRGTDAPGDRLLLVGDGPAAPLVAQRAPSEDLRIEAGPVAVRLVADASELGGAIVGESERQRQLSGACLVVVGDRSLASSLEQLGSGDLRVVAAADLGRALADEPGAGLVVLGGARVLGRSLSRVPYVARTHVAVAPPGSAREDRERWCARLLSHHPVRTRLGPATGRGLAGRGDLQAADFAHDRDRGLGRALGRG